jgi:hypothetical protein
MTAQVDAGTTVSRETDFPEHLREVLTVADIVYMTSHWKQPLPPLALFAHERAILDKVMAEQDRKGFR